MSGTVECSRLEAPIEALVVLRHGAIFVERGTALLGLVASDVLEHLSLRLCNGLPVKHLKVTA